MSFLQFIESEGWYYPTPSKGSSNGFPIHELYRRKEPQKFIFFIWKQKILSSKGVYLNTLTQQLMVKLLEYWTSPQTGGCS